ncbi:MAG: response regulator, partial [Myxococcales bacterium]|nr:response regulator [Myxococcales bacterium]
MAQRILAFEADSNFAAELSAGFGSLGVEVEVVADGTAGLERAGAAPPDLILLSIELPGMNGFLVCKKIKKNAQLKSIPLIILSSDGNAEEIFEQHKKLRTRAEDYLKKPVGFDVVYERSAKLIGLDDAGALTVSAEEPLEDPTEMGSRDEVDDEIDAFADDAFDSIMLDEDDGDDDLIIEASEPEPEPTAVVEPGPEPEPEIEASEPEPEADELEMLDVEDDLMEPEPAVAPASV